MAANLRPTRAGCSCSMAKLPKRHHQCPDAACRQSGLGDGPRQQMEPCHGEQTSNRSRASCARSSRSPLTMRHSEHHSRRHGWGCMQVVLLPTRVRSRARSRVRRTTRRIETEKVGLVQLGGLEPPTSCSTDRRSNQLSYNCIRKAGPEKGCRTGRKLGATPRFGKAGTTGRSPQFQSKSPGNRPGLPQGMPGDQAAGL